MCRRQSVASVMQQQHPAAGSAMLHSPDAWRTCCSKSHSQCKTDWTRFAHSANTCKLNSRGSASQADQALCLLQGIHTGAGVAELPTTLDSTTVSYKLDRSIL